MSDVAEKPPVPPRPLDGQNTELFAGRYLLLKATEAAWSGVELPATDTVSGRKVLLRRFNGTPVALAEIERFAIFSHPGVQEILDLVTADGETCIVLEFLAGEPLADFVRHSPFRIVRLVNFARQGLAALAAAHSAGWVHPCLTPNCIFLVHDSQFLNFTVKLRDFGPLAQGCAGDDAFLSPEQLGGQAPTRLCNLYSFAAVLLFGITGRLPVAGQPVPELRSFPPGLARWFKEALAPDPRDRAPDAETMLAELERSLADPAPEPACPQVVSAPPPPRPAPPARPPTHPVPAAPAFIPPVKPGRSIRPLLVWFGPTIVLLLAGLGYWGSLKLKSFSGSTPDEPTPALAAFPTPAATPVPSATPAPSSKVFAVEDLAGLRPLLGKQVKVSGRVLEVVPVHGRRYYHFRFSNPPSRSITITIKTGNAKSWSQEQIKDFKGKSICAKGTVFQLKNDSALFLQLDRVSDLEIQ